MGFRQFHTLDLSGWKASKRDARTSELLRSVERRLRGKEEPAPATQAPKSQWRIPLPRGKLLWAAAAFLVLIMAAGAALMIWNAQNASSKPQKPTIALLPFTTASPDPELRQIASQTRDSIAHTFSESGVPLRLLSAPPQNGRPAVDFIISGDVSRKGDTVLATVRLDEAAHGVTVFSHQFEAGREDLRDLPERIGAQMAGNLTWNFPMMLLDRRRPLDPAVLTELLTDADFTKGLGGLQSYQMSKRVAAKAPDFHVTQSALAFNTAFTLVDLPREERAEAVAEARRASDRVVALAPNFGDSYSPWCLLRSETLWAACEDRLRSAKRIDPDAPFLNTFLSHLLRNVGRFEESMDLAKLAHTHDVYVPTKIAWMLKTLETEGESDGAQELYQQAARWWPEYKPMFFRNRLYGLIARGDFEAIVRLERDSSVKNFMPEYQDSRAIVAAMKSRSLPAARNACPETDDWFVILRCMTLLASLGDQDGSYAIADKIFPRRLGRTPAETEQIWLDEPDAPALEFITSPAAAAMRRDPRYVPLAERVGLLAYWQSGRPPDFCKRNPEPVCKQLVKKK